MRPIVLFFALLLVLALMAPGAAQAGPSAPKADVAAAAAGSPLLLVENAGQWPPSTSSGQAPRFQAWGSPLGAATTWLAADAIWLVVGGGEWESGRAGDENVFSPSPSHPITPSPLTALKLTFPGRSPDVRIEPFAPSSATVSYFLGDPSQWRADVPVWGGVRYVDLYPGIDLEIGDSGWRLTADPGADLSAVALLVEGAEAAALEGDALLVATGAGEVRLPLLQVAGQPAGGAQVQSTGVAAFQVSAPFAAAEATPRAPDDDPADLLYSTFLGGSNYSGSQNIALDGDANAYVVGFTRASDFPVTPGAFDPSYNGDNDLFVAKLNAAGSALVYATFLGGNDDDYGPDIAVDGSGNAFVTGYTWSSDFPTTPGAFDTTHSPGWDAYVTKLNAAGSALVYSTFLGGSLSDFGYGIAVDGTGAAYVSGRAQSTDFPTTPGAFDPTNVFAADKGFVAKLNPAGSDLDYATYLGGSVEDHCFAIAIDGAGNAYVTGYTWSSDFPTTPGAFDTSFDGDTDGFAAKLNATGSALVYSTFLGGASWEEGNGIAVDGTGNAFVMGITGSSDFPTTPGAFDTSLGGSQDAFVTKLNASGSGLGYSTYLGGSSSESYGNLALDATSRAYVTASTYSIDFPITPGAFDTSYNGSYDAVVARLNASGSELEYGTYLGGASAEYGHGIALDSAGNAFVTGQTSSDDFPTTAGAFDPDFNGFGDAYVAKLDVSSGPPTAVELTGLQAENGGTLPVVALLALAAPGLALLAGMILRKQRGSAQPVK